VAPPGNKGVCPIKGKALLPPPPPRPLVDLSLTAAAPRVFTSRRHPCRRLRLARRRQQRRASPRGPPRRTFSAPLFLVLACAPAVGRLEPASSPAAATRGRALRARDSARRRGAVARAPGSHAVVSTATRAPTGGRAPPPRTSLKTEKEKIKQKKKEKKEKIKEKSENLYIEKRERKK